MSMEISSADAQRLVEAIVKLANDAASLRRDVRRLANAFFPQMAFDEDQPSSMTVGRSVKTVDDLLRVLRSHRESLGLSQSAVGNMEAILKTIREKIGSRADWEHFKSELAVMKGKSEQD